ncbi:MAG: DNA gyrase subunit A [Candidatus Krumholzibacteriota bacterium]|nr:DNA gyrase subunit A [Candidatus Krumholzibacteriota bacterium]
MDLSRQRVIPVYIEDKMKSSYLDYSMSVIISRALPDVRDGLKPVHRRILLAMNDLSLTHNKAYRKSAKLTGDVSGNYHPHGTASVYGAVVRLAQDFSLRYPLIDGQGNFGSIDGDSAAAERYTEVRMAAIAEELLADLDKETVEFGPNYDETRQMALVLPSKVPNLLINGASGIAVGMATNIPPHNLREIIDGLKALLQDPDIGDDKLYRHVKGPDFPTGGIIYGRAGIKEAYRTGRGRITLRARANIETQKGGKTSIVISEIPYQTNKSSIIEKVAELVRGGKLSGISDIRDESDKEGLRIVVDLKRDSYPKVVLSHLFKHTALQGTFGIIMLSLNKLMPEVMSLKKMMRLFLDHREEVITRSTQYDLARAEERAHILEGYKIALDNIDAIIKLIKKSASPAEAKNAMMKGFKLTDPQAQAILDMKLQRLTGLERKKIEDEYLALIQKIAYYRSILENRNMLLSLIAEELEELKEKYGDARRTEIIDADGEVNIEDLIAEEEMIITVTHSGYIKRIPVGTYKRQKRGGKGITGMGMKDEDFVKQMFIASTHSYILFFTNMGKCFRLKVHEIPQGGRLARGKAMVNFFPIGAGEKITELIPVSDFDNGDYLVMVTRNGVVKKTELSSYSRVHSGGLIAIKLREEDSLVSAKLTSGSDDIIIAKKKGKLIRFNENQIRPVSRASIGVKGVTLDKEDEVVEMVIVKREADLFFITENGYGKRTRISAFKNINRGGKGVICIQTGERNGNLVTSREVIESDELMIITMSGMIIRCPVTGVRVVGRATKGVRIINLKEGDKVVDVAMIAGVKNGDDDSGADGAEIADSAEIEEEENGAEPEEE